MTWVQYLQHEMYTYSHACINPCFHTNTHININTHSWINTYKYMHACIYMCAYMYVYIYVNIWFKKVIIPLIWINILTTIANLCQHIMNIVYVSYRLKLYNNCIRNNVNILHPISKCFISLAISFGKQRWSCCLNIFPRCEDIPIVVQRLCYANILVPKRNGRCYEFKGTAPRNIGVTEKQNANCFGRCLKSLKDKSWSCKNMHWYIC